MIGRWGIRVALLFCGFVFLTAICKGLSPVVALLRGGFSGLILIVVLVLFDLGWSALGPEREGKKNAAGVNRRNHSSQIEPDLIERLKKDPVRGAELIHKMSCERQVKERWERKQ